MKEITKNKARKRKKSRVMIIAFLLHLLLNVGCAKNDSIAETGKDAQSTLPKEQTVTDWTREKESPGKSEMLPEEGTLTGKTIGICMPETEQERWQEDAKQIKMRLEDKGCKVMTEFAENAEKQKDQIETMLVKKAQLLIIAPVESDGLAEVLNKAADQGISVISYDEVIMDTDAVDYYVMFNHYQAGRMQGAYIAERFPIADGQRRATQNMTVQVLTERENSLSAKAMYQGLEDELLLSLEETKILLTQNGEGMDAPVKVRQSQCQESQEREAATLLQVGLCRQNHQRPATDSEEMVVYQDTANEALAVSIVAETMLMDQNIEKAVKALQDQKFECFYNTQSYDNGTGIIPGFLISSEPLKD